MRNFSIIIIFSLLLIVGCNASDNSNATATATATATANPDTQASTNNINKDYKGLTSDYLVGDWCYTHYQAIDPSNQTISREEINQNFIFAADGNYITQQDSDAPMTTKGIYEFLPQGVFKLIIGKTNVVSVNPEGFVLHNTVDHFFDRGVCK